MLLRLQRYNYELEFKPGCKLILADTLSRAYPDNVEEIRYPQSTGRAEAAVKTAKRRMSKAKESNRDPFFALLTKAKQRNALAVGQTVRVRFD